MHQSSRLYVGLDVPKESIAVAYVAQEPHAEVYNVPQKLDRSLR